MNAAFKIMQVEAKCVNTYDKLKIVTTLKNIQVLDEGKFTCEYKNGIMTRRKCRTNHPFSMSLDLDYARFEAIIEFTGKALKHEYPKLISLDTIRKCFDNINALRIVMIDVDATLEDANVVKCDVTKDISVGNVQKLTTYIRGHMKNYQRYLCRVMANGNLILEKNVVSNTAKKRLTIYDKGKEMQKAENNRFSAIHDLIRVFDGCSRFEMNLNSMVQIRKTLHVDTNNLMAVLSSEVNPIRDMLMEVMADYDDKIDYNDRKTYFCSLVLKDCNYDLEKVEAKMRGLYAKRGANIKNIMKPYMDLRERIMDSKYQYCWKQIMEMLQ